ncbi:MAG: glycoside hydrolase family 32 protein, partial [Saprospiraceae bacterium]|nr:glycoside hydrolase family 32 protein [Saprospiraceae bacterium]
MLSLLSCKEDTKHEANKQAVSLYHEHYRPQYHFTPEKMWMNDPNGLVFYEGEYHLFYQYYADDLTAGPRSWGHAVSSDLMRWQQLPIAIKPDSLGEI